MNTRYYTTKDVLKKVGISRTTLFLWLWNKKVPDVKRNRNGHRVFTEIDIQRILNYKNKLTLPE
ncbi:MAG: MerR family transcriptional regulator [Candidatus Omnitrophica bacterium]|jgi:DNA-binding transcriptional MerR regulator|nr:MerR family transcriptional regulator [Candidatus Omnitrophota bacterium]